MLYNEIKTEYPGGEGELATFKDPHPVWRPHLLQVSEFRLTFMCFECQYQLSSLCNTSTCLMLQGWAPDWIPSLVDKASSRIDKVVHIGGDEAWQLARHLQQKKASLRAPAEDSRAANKRIKIKTTVMSK